MGILKLTVLFAKFLRGLFKMTVPKILYELSQLILDDLAHRNIGDSRLKTKQKLSLFLAGRSAILFFFCAWDGHRVALHYGIEKASPRVGVHTRGPKESLLS